MILAIDDEDVAFGVAADALGAIKDRVLGGRVVAFVAAFAGAGDGGDDTPVVNHADGAAFAFADVGIALAVDADRAGADDDRLVRGAIVATLGAIDFHL